MRCSSASSSSFSVRRWSAMILSLFILAGCSNPIPVPTPEAASTPAPSSDSMPDKMSEQQLKDLVAKMDVQEKVGQLVIVSFETTEVDTKTEAWLRTNKIGNVIVYAKNIENAEQATSLTGQLQKTIRNATQIPAFIGIDQEGGMVNRVREGVTIFPSPMAIAAGRHENLYSLAWSMADELSGMGFNMNFAPVLDVNSNPDNPVIHLRAYGDDPQAAANFASIWIKGLQEGGMVSVAKHFPGHGDTSEDSHFALPKVNKTLDELKAMELIPFEAAIHSGVSAIMTSHILFPKIEKEKIPATLSKTIVTDLLKDELGYNGIVISDSLQMDAIQAHYGMAEAAVKAIQAGVDMLILGDGKVLQPDSEDVQTPVIEALIEAVGQGTITAERLDDAVLSILRIKNDYGLFIDQGEQNHAPYDIDLNAHQVLVQETSDQSMTLIRDDVSALPLPTDSTLFVSFPCVYPLAFDKKSFGEVAADSLFGKAVNVHQDPTQSEIEDILQKASGYDTIVLLVYNMADSPNQLNLLTQLLETEKPIVVICAGSPYDLQYLEDAPTVLCTYGYTPSAVLSAISVLNGTLLPEGKLPVEIPEK
ncbi:beta-N-acetylhexosaminidase [Holdemania massiliensis]|uniref:beta-N-acetylhexosaminidase n=1 Tax=Holdemania massiliensis TaxID=1468449 RepID=UPI0036F331F3